MKLTKLPVLSAPVSLILSASLFFCVADATAQVATSASAAETPSAFENPDLVETYQATITPEDLAAYLYVFASDYFEGRETATRGQQLAATFLAGQYRKLGVAPFGNAAPHDSYSPSAYFQPVRLYTQRTQSATLTVARGTSKVATSTFGVGGTDGDSYLIFGSMPERSGGVVFAGYGIGDEELGYDDFAALDAAGISVADKWVLILNDEPLADDSTSLLKTEDGKPSRWTQSFNSKLRGVMMGSGLPAGIMIVGDVGPRALDVSERAKERASDLATSVGSLSLEANAGGGRPFPPVFVVSSSFADQVLSPSGRTVSALKTSIDSSLKPEVFEVAGTTVSSAIDVSSVEVSSENVVAYIEGSDPVLKDEFVVVSSHYDHIGISEGEGDTINNGADDDGSGTVAILEIAEAFVKAKADGNGPRRSVLFLNVTGEEKGLLGSRFFTDMDPLVPLENIVTNLNIDMIGRFDPTHPTGSQNYVYIIGSNLISQELHDINAKVNELTEIGLEMDERFNSKDDPNQFYRRSDHWNFGKHGIPFIFYFTGTHEDYHGVGDEPHKIEYDRMARIARVIFATAWQVANQDERPAVSGQGFN